MSDVELTTGADTGNAGKDVTVIESRPGWVPVDVKECWRYHELLYFLVWRDLKARFKQTVLGAAWAVIQPVFSLVLFSIIFGKVAGFAPEGRADYPLFLYAALLPWGFFSRAVSQSGISLVGQANILTKIYFPRVFVPLSVVGVCLVDFALSFGVYLCLMVYFGQMPGWQIVFLPFVILLTVFVASGLGLLLSALTVTYRDFKNIIPFALQMGMYLTPVVYALNESAYVNKVVPEKYRLLMSVNPMAGVTAMFRWMLLGETMYWPGLVLSVGVSVAIFFAGLFVFRRTERRFADIA